MTSPLVEGKFNDTFGIISTLLIAFTSTPSMTSPLLEGKFNDAFGIISTLLMALQYVIGM